MAGADDEEAQVARLVARVAALDDHDAFAALVRLYESPMRRFLRRLCHGSDDADDLAQNAFLKAYRHIATFRGEGRFVSWLLRIAYQEFVSSRRRALEPLAEEASPVDAGAGDRLVASLSLEQAMTALRVEEQAALTLHYHEQLTHPEIAAVMAVPVGTVKSLILRGREKLRARLSGGPCVRGTDDR